MRRSKPEPRYIDPASVDVGDTVKAQWIVGAVEHTRTGIVTKIENRSFYAVDGQEIFQWWHGTKIRITLLEKAPERTTPYLFELPDNVTAIRDKIS